MFPPRMLQSATVCFCCDFASATLGCYADNEEQLQREVLRLIQECGLGPVCGKLNLVVMACYGASGLDADMTRRIQFAVLDWMIAQELIDNTQRRLPKRLPHVHGAEFLENANRRTKENMGKVRDNAKAKRKR